MVLLFISFGTLCVTQIDIKQIIDSYNNIAVPRIEVHDFLNIFLNMFLIANT